MKSVGVGIGLNLDRLECHIHSAVSNSTVVCDTEMWIDGDVDNNASFEESMLDDRHLVVVCLKQVCCSVHSHCAVFLALVMAV